MTMRLTVALAICLTFLFTSPVLGKIVQVFVTFRHGARGPIRHITDISAWDLPHQLTPVGMRQIYLLGDELRRRYILQGGLISENYDPRSFYIRSSQVNRTLQSAYSFLAGLFPAGTGPNFTDKYPLERAIPPIKSDFKPESLGRSALPKNFQAVPVHSAAKTSDFILRAYSDACPNMKQYTTKAINDPAYKMIMDKFKPKFEEVIKTLGIPTPKMNMETMQHLADVMQMTYLDNRQIGGGLVPGSDLYNQMEIFHNISSIYLLNAYPIQNQVCSTAYFNDIIRQMEAAVTGVSPLKFITYSANDGVVNCVMSALGLINWQCIWENYLDGKYTEFNTSCPFTAQPASNLIFELSEEEGKYYVNLMYNGMNFQLNKKDKLEFSEFKAFVKSITLENYKDDCLGLKTAPNSLLSWWQILVLVLQSVFIIGLATLLFNYCLKVHRLPSSLRKSLLEDRV